MSGLRKCVCVCSARVLVLVCVLIESEQLIRTSDTEKGYYYCSYRIFSLHFCPPLYSERCVCDTYVYLNAFVCLHPFYSALDSNFGIAQKHVMWALMGKIHFLNGHFRLTLVICGRLSPHYDSFEIHLMEWWQHFRWIEIKFHVSRVSTRQFFSIILLAFAFEPGGPNDHHHHRHHHNER